MIEGAFVIDGGRLSTLEPGVFEADPINLLRLFRIAGERGLDLHPDAMTEATRRTGLITARVRRDPAAARVFLDILARLPNPRRALDLMNEAGVLGRFIPEWGHVVAKMQYNMYHAYTVDEHTLRAVGVIGDIAAGRFHEDHPTCTAIFPLIEDREALFLALLLHDTGKGVAGGQEKAGARAARAGMRAPRPQAPRIDLVAWLVENHLVMSDVAQKRDISDPATVAGFVSLGGDAGAACACCWSSRRPTSAPWRRGWWNGWTGPAPAQALHRGGNGLPRRPTLRCGGRPGPAPARKPRPSDARTALVNADASARPWATAMEDAYFAATSPAPNRLATTWNYRAAPP